MTRRGLAPISRSDLRDHATEERIDRIWERIDADLPAVDGAASPSRWMVGVLAAVVASLAGGLLLGKLIWDQPVPVEVSSTPTVATTDAERSLGVFAAGTRGQTYPLPGGGQIVLSPGTMLELVRQQGNVVELRLVQGEATIDTMGVPSDKLVAVFAGEALLSTQGGGLVRVRRDEHDLEVRVADGSVSVRSPDGEQRLAKGDHVRTALLRTARPVARLVPVPEASSPAFPVQQPVAVAEPPAPGPSVPDWQVRSRAGDSDDAFRLLRAQPGGIDAVILAAGDADSLWEIHDVAIRQDPGAAYRALTRVAEAFPGDASAQLAAYKLGNYYRRAGQHELANKWFAQAAESPEGVLAEDALCKQFRTAPNETEALRFAQEYLVKYPDGRCKPEAERLISGDPSDETDEPPAEPPKEEKPVEKSPD